MAGGWEAAGVYNTSIELLKSGARLESGGLGVEARTLHSKEVYFSVSVNVLYTCAFTGEMGRL